MSVAAVKDLGHPLEGLGLGPYSTTDVSFLLTLLWGATDDGLMKMMVLGLLLLT